MLKCPYEDCIYENKMETERKEHILKFLRCTSVQSSASTDSGYASASLAPSSRASSRLSTANRGTRRLSTNSSSEIRPSASFTVERPPIPTDCAEDYIPPTTAYLPSYYQGFPSKNFHSAVDSRYGSTVTRGTGLTPLLQDSSLPPGMDDQASAPPISYHLFHPGPFASHFHHRPPQVTILSSQAGCEADERAHGQHLGFEYQVRPRPNLTGPSYNVSPRPAVWPVSSGLSLSSFCGKGAYVQPCRDLNVSSDFQATTTIAKPTQQRKALLKTNSEETSLLPNGRSDDSLEVLTKKKTSHQGSRAPELSGREGKIITKYA